MIEHVPALMHDYLGTHIVCTLMGWLGVYLFGARASRALFVARSDVLLFDLDRLPRHRV